MVRPRRRLWWLFGGVHPALFTTATWILAKQLQQRGTVNKLMKCTRNFDVSEVPRFSQQKGANSSPWQRPTAYCTKDAAKVKWFGFRDFVSSTILTGPLPHCLPFFKQLDKFHQEKRFINENDAKSAFDAFIDSGNQDFYLTGINKLIFRLQKCFNSNGCYFE